jgi:uracil-DNA glycosylase
VNPEQLKARTNVRQQIASCTNCPLHRGCNSPVAFHGPSPNGIIVVGEAPGSEEDAQGKPFVGPAGQLARELIRGSGMDPETMAWANVVCCYPHRTPTASEVAACKNNLANQISVVHPFFALVFGGIAVSAFHQHRIGEIRGRWWRMRGVHAKHDDPWALATWHPAAALRNVNLVGEIKRDLMLFRLVVEGKAELKVNTSCIKCGAEGSVIEKEIAFCPKHRPGAMKAGVGAGRASKKTRSDASGSQPTQDSALL